jgi:hypothetical protein
MITNAIDAVKEFNKAFKIEYSETQEANLDDSTVELRYRLMQDTFLIDLIMFFSITISTGPTGGLPLPLTSVAPLIIS